jgi:hypothetical protein
MELPDDRTIILNVLKGTAPERKEEIEALWERYAPEVAIVPPRPGVVMNANKKRIEFDAKLIDIFWIIGYAAWSAVETYSPLVVLGPYYGVSLEKLINADERYTEGERHLKEIVATARSFIQDGIDPDRWPDMIPCPGPDRECLTTPEKAIYDLVIMALAFCWLHEFRHVTFLQEDSNPTNRPDEELACDSWARAFIVDKLDTYAKAAGVDYHRVLGKRMTAMALAVFILKLLTPAHAAFGDADYPPLGDRIMAIVGGTGLHDDADFWTFAGCVLVGIRRLDHLPVDVVAGSRKELAEKLLHLMQ